MQLALASVISGQVIATQARWTDDGQRIVTDAIVETDAGDRLTVSELGGVKDGLGQISMPGPALLEPGMRVDVDAHDGATLTGAHMMVVDDARVVRVADSGAFVREGPTPAGNYLFWPNGCIFMSYDAAGTTELAARNTFVIDPEGKIVKVYSSVNPNKHSQEVLSALDELQKRASAK